MLSLINPPAVITLLAVENDPLQARVLTHELAGLGYTLAGLARSADEAEALFETLNPDLVLLDVHLDGPRDGIETAAALVARRPVPLIFITAFPDGPTFERARQVGPFAFLGKPYSGRLLVHSIELALQHFASGQSSATAAAAEPVEGAVLLGGVFVYEQQRYLKVPLAEVLVLEADGNYVHLRTAGRKHTLHQSLAQLLARLPAVHFQQVHRSFVVQVAAIENFDPRLSTVQVGPHTVPVGRSFRAGLLERLG